VLTTTVTAAGTWSVTSPALSDGVVTVVASVSDAVGNVGSATQSLTIDTTAPSLAIAGGSQFTTKDSTPTISGTTNAPSGSLVTVTVGGQSLTAVVVSGGTWSVTAALLPDGVATVVATVADAVGNVATATQALKVDLSVPVVHTLTDHVYFRGNSSVISAAARAEIAALSRRVPANATTVTVQITGYIKLIGRATENKRLASARAQKVYLLMKGKVAGAYSVTGVARGLSFQVTARRADITISYTLPGGN
jgi:outer membrane protein OmpA-like peptidoglycan-associated protein